MIKKDVLTLGEEDRGLHQHLPRTHIVNLVHDNYESRGKPCMHALEEEPSLDRLRRMTGTLKNKYCQGVEPSCPIFNITKGLQAGAKGWKHEEFRDSLMHE